jgi:Acyltransferase
MSEFDDIRPYYDHEVRPTLDRILADSELIQAVTHLTFPKTENWLGWLWRPLVRAKLKRELASVQNVHGFQQIVEKYMTKMINSRVKSVTISGLDKLDKTRSYLFISNHRDIAMDPAFVNWVLFHNHNNTLRIAIGDNLLTKPFASDLMRLNKSFIVNRSAKAPREKLKAAKHLSAYIHHSIVNEHSSIWIAQREGRAKDGCDKTNSAVLGMLALNKPKTESLADYIRSLHIVPVSISYELDPCDAAKARELYLQKIQGSYQKEEHEDVRSIAMGISGQKGHIHLAFGQEMQADYQDTDDLVAELDQQILNNYVLHATNCFAYEMLFNKIPDVKYSDKQIVYNSAALVEEKAAFVARMQAIPEEHREIALAIYANPVKSKLTSNAQ